jgi:hypothetical protein
MVVLKMKYAFLAMLQRFDRRAFKWSTDAPSSAGAMAQHFYDCERLQMSKARRHGSALAFATATILRGR